MLASVDNPEFDIITYQKKKDNPEFDKKGHNHISLLLSVYICIA